MKIFLDTSVLVAAVIEQHADHERAFAVLERVHNNEDEGVVSAHGLAEAYSILTQLPAPFRHSPEQALISIEANILKHFKTVSLSGHEYAAVIREAAGMGIQGGTIYDAVLLRSAAKAGAGRVYTLNLKHFQAVASPELTAILSAP